MKLKKNFIAATMLAGAMTALSFMSAGAAQAQGALVMYCGVQEEWCRAMVNAFERETGIKVSMTRKSAGEIYAQVKAESANPRADIWWGGTGDPHMQAAEEGLTVEYKSPKMSELQDWAVRQWEQSKQRTVGIYSGALGFGYNTELMKSKGVQEPKCWADLLNAKLKDEVQVADPNSSGTAYTLLATIVQIMGEDKGFDYLKALHKNINQYTKSGAAPAKAHGARRDDGRHRVHARHRHDGGRQGADQGGRSLRGHRLRDRLHVDHQGRQEHGQRQEVLRLGADRRQRRSSAPKPSPTRCRRTRARRSRRRLPSSTRSS